MKRPMISYDAGSFGGQLPRASRPFAPAGRRAGSFHEQSPGRQAGSAAVLGPSAGARNADHRAGRSGALRWAGAGFLVGIVFWHFVGFWDFLSDTVLYENNEPAAQAELAAAPPGDVHPAQRPFAPPPAEPAQRSPAGAIPSAEKPAARRQERTGWSVSLTSSTSPPSAQER